MFRLVIRRLLFAAAVRAYIIITIVFIAWSLFDFAIEDNAKGKGQVDAIYSTAGDKYRLTLVNISAVRNWFKVSEMPVCKKPKAILLVPAARHCRLSDITGGRWNKTVRYTSADGEEHVFTEGESCKGLLSGYQCILDSFEDKD